MNGAGLRLGQAGFQRPALLIPKQEVFPYALGNGIDARCDAGRRYVY